MVHGAVKQHPLTLPVFSPCLSGSISVFPFDGMFMGLKLKSHEMEVLILKRCSWVRKPGLPCLPPPCRGENSRASELLLLGN